MLLLSGARKALRETKVTIWLNYYRLFKPRRILTLQGRTYPYLYNRYNLTFTNERAIEVPIALDAVRRYPPERTLEVGNVLSHYFPVSHDVLDKYETANGVVNADVVDFDPDKRYGLIVSVSTLEHVGWDEQPRDPEKFLRAVDHLTTLLTPGGRLLMTLPVGYNHEVDRFLAERRIPFTTMACAKRVSPDTVWREATWDEVDGTEYIKARRNGVGMMFGATAAAVVIGEIVRS